MKTILHLLLTAVLFMASETITCAQSTEIWDDFVEKLQSWQKANNLKEDELSASETDTYSDSLIGEDLWKMGKEYYDAENYEEAEELFLEAYKSGCLLAACYLGFIEFKDENYKSAKHWLIKSLPVEESLDVSAVSFMIGVCDFLLSDYESTKMWMKDILSKDPTNANALLYIGLSQYEEFDVDEALATLRKAAECGSSDAEVAIGVYHFSKDHYTLAFRWFQKATKAENSEGTFFLSLCYLVGKGVTQDLDEGIRLMCKAAEMGSDDAMMFLLSLLNDEEEEADSDDFLDTQIVEDSSCWIKL